jgi:hypothetical protein
MSASPAPDDDFCTRHPDWQPAPLAQRRYRHSDLCPHCRQEARAAGWIESELEGRRQEARTLASIEPVPGADRFERERERLAHPNLGGPPPDKLEVAKFAKHVLTLMTSSGFITPAEAKRIAKRIEKRAS